MQKIPFVDLYAQYKSIQNEMDAAIKTSIQNTSFIGGNPVREFETAFAGFIGLKHVIGVAMAPIP